MPWNPLRPSVRTGFACPCPSSFFPQLPSARGVSTYCSLLRHFGSCREMSPHPKLLLQPRGAGAPGLGLPQAQLVKSPAHRPRACSSVANQPTRAMASTPSFIGGATILPKARELAAMGSLKPQDPPKVSKLATPHLFTLLTSLILFCKIHSELSPTLPPPEWLWGLPVGPTWCAVLPISGDLGL